MMFRNVVILIVGLLLSSCKVWNPNELFRRAGQDLQLSDLASKDTYTIVQGDVLEILVYTNEGYKLVDAGLAGPATGGLAAGLTYTVDINGLVRLPKIDTVTVIGLQIAEAAELIEKRFEDHVVAPFVQLRVANKRAIVYRGDDEASVVPLQNERMSLLEVIAAAGGIPATGKAYNIKVIREVDGNVRVASVDLRDATAVNYANALIEPNDVVIIDPAFETTFIQQLTPFLSVLTGAVAIYSLVVALNNS